MIKHEEVRDNVVKIIEVISVRHCKILQDNILNIDNYITEQEKKDKLLELYRELAYQRAFNNREKEEKYLLNEIKELEEELK